MGSAALVNSVNTYQGVSTLWKLLHLPARNSPPGEGSWYCPRTDTLGPAKISPQTPRLATSQNYRDTGSKVAI